MKEGPEAPISHILEDRSQEAPEELLAGALASFALFIWTMHRVERSLNERGGSLFYPWRVRGPVSHARRIGKGDVMEWVEVEVRGFLSFGPFRPDFYGNMGAFVCN